MRSMHRLMGVFAATAFAAGSFFANPATAAPVLPEGTPIAGEPASLLGYDAGLNDYVAGGLSAVNDGNIEFLTDDFALGIDFQSDGLLRLWDNLGTGSDLFNFTLRFSFAGLGVPLIDIRPLDVSDLTSGDLQFHVIDRDTLELSLHDVTFAEGFAHADLRVAVDEPAMLSLFALGIFGFYAARRTRFIASTGVAL